MHAVVLFTFRKKCTADNEHFISIFEWFWSDIFICSTSLIVIYRNWWNQLTSSILKTNVIYERFWYQLQRSNEEILLMSPHTSHDTSLTGKQLSKPNNILVQQRYTWCTVSKEIFSVSEPLSYYTLWNRMIFGMN